MYQLVDIDLMLFPFCSVVVLGLSILIFNYVFISPRKYQYLLESPKQYRHNKRWLSKINNNNPLVKQIDQFCKENDIYANGAIVSLSGGVDSMVTLAILLYLKTIHNFNIYTATIDYGLRKESNDETRFLIDYAKFYGIVYNVSYITDVSRKKENSGTRTDFEERSRDIRFNAYKEIIETNKLNSNVGVFVAHHQDDIIENIFTNSMRGGNLLDLEVMKPISKNREVNIFRPLLQFKKQVIYDFAHEYGIPYFLDTTPKWSNRGKMRNEIFPLLDDVFGTSWRYNIKNIGTQSNQWGSYINQMVLVPLFNQVELHNTDIKKYIKISVINEQPDFIYHSVIMNSLHSIGEKMLKKTSVERIIDLIHKNEPKLIPLDGHRSGIFTRDKKYIVIFNQTVCKLSLNDF
jgi:tRNA(Ile)-lysidine synthetase-like protein